MKKNFKFINKKKKKKMGNSVSQKYRVSRWWANQCENSKKI